MKCKICGHRANSLPAMGKHYRKAHPNMMKKRRKVPRVAVREEGYTEFAYEDAKPFTPQQADKIEKIVVDVIHRMSSR